MADSQETAFSDHSGPISLDGEDDTTPAPENGRLFSSATVGSDFPHVRPRPLYVDSGLRSIQELPEAYRSVFKDYPCFNRVQSMVMDDVLYSAEPLVVTAPTGSGKTVLFELAIIQLLMSYEKASINNDFKIVYMAPVKALCSEKLHDWARKFSRLNINCIEVTGDSDVADLNHLNRHHIVLTTPEKWDSLTRRWRDHSALMKTVRLFLIDEVHILNEESRGPTLEAVVSRMKMLQQQQRSDNHSLPTLRFIAVSATIPNVEDLAQWLGTHEKPAKYFRMEESMRPVQLKKVVKGYDSNFSGFMFDVHLSYKLKQVISQYSDGKPTLVFCSTRKSVLATAQVLSKMITFSFTDSQKEALARICSQIVDNKIRELAKVGIGCHHAGLVMTDRNLLETAFRDSLVPVLMATSTLAMGVNLPAHLVVIKSTQYYGNGGYQDYSDSQLLQMIGRAGRPQFDTSAVAVIMTKSSCEQKYVRLTAGTEPIQSSLHRHLVEYLNAEVVLGTVRDIPGAVDWMRSTFLFVRANRHPKQYGLSDLCAGSAVKINAKLQDMVQVELNGLAKYKLVETNGMDIQDTPAGRLMARYYVAFQTMKSFMQVEGEETLSDLLVVLSRAAEFQDVQLRNDEKAALNKLNSRKDCAPGLRFPIKGRIKDRECKVNCLLQSLLGGLHIAEPGLQQEAGRVIRTAERLARCLCEVVQLSGRYVALLSAVLLHKCVRCQLWETSALAARQLPRIGPVLAGLLVAAGKTSLAAVAQSNPRDLERIVLRLPPFGNELRDAAAAVPQLVLTLERNRDGGEDVVVLQADIANLDAALNDPRHWVLVLAGDSDNNVIVYDRFPISKLFRGTYFTKIDLSTVSATTVKAHLISESWVGIDCEKSLTINEDPPPPFQEPAAKSLKKRSTFMDKIMKEAASRTSDTPSCRLTASETGGLTLSQRFERFKKTPNLKKLSSLAMDDDLDDPDDPPPGPSAPRATPAAGGVDEVIVIEDDDHDNNWDMPDVQVVPGSPRAPSSVASSMEYSAIPHQPTIRNFFKPTSGLGSGKSAPPVCVDLEDSCERPTPALSAWVHLEDSYSNLSHLAGKTAWVQKSAPAPSGDHEGAWGPPTPAPSATVCVDLMDDSWDDDILQVTRAAETNVTTQRIVRWRPPTPPPGYVEMRPGCWDFNFDIGIDDLLDDLLQDDEHTADAKPEKFEVKEEPETLDFNEWCAQEDRNILGPETELLASDLVKGTGTLKTFELEHLGTDKKWSDGNVIVDKKMESTPVQSSWLGANFTQSDKLPDSYLGYDKWPDADVEHTGNWSDEDLWTGHKLPDTDVKPSANRPQQTGTCPDQVSEHGDKLAGVKIEATEKLSDTNFEQGDKLPDTNVGYSDKLPDSNLDRDKLPGVNIGHIAKLPNSNLERDKCYNVNVEHADDRFDVDFGQGTKLPDANTGRTDELRGANLRLDEYLPVTAGELLTPKPGDCGRDRLPFVEGEQVKEAAAPLETGPPREAPATEFETPRMDTNAMDQTVDPFASPSDAAAAAPPVAEGAQTNADHSCAQQEALQGGVTSVANAAGDAIQRPDLHVEERERGDNSEPAVGGELPVLATVVSVPDRVSEAVTVTSPTKGGSPASPQRDTTDDGKPGDSNELQIPLLASANIQDRGTSPKSKQPEEVVREATFQDPNRPPCASLLERKCITFADELVGTEEIVEPEDPRKGESRPGQSIAQLGKTFQSVLAANQPNPGTCNLLKFRPQNEGAHNVDDVLARLLADWSNGKPSGKPSARPASSVPPAPRAAPGLLQGALSGAPARRTSAGIVSVPAKAPQEEVAKVDCVERLLQEGVPTRLLGKSVVKTINTDRLRAAGVIRGSGTVLSKRLASGLSAALAVVTQEAKEAPGRTATSDPPRAAPLTGEACVRGSPRTPHAAPAKLADTNALPPGDPPCAPPSAPPAPLGAAPLGAAPPSSRASGSAASVKSGSTRAPSLLSSFIKIPSRGEQLAAEPAAPGPGAKLDWFERLLAEPIGGPLRQPRAATSKRKAQGVQDPGPREPKRPAKGPSSAAVSPWPHRLTLPPKDIYASRPIAKQYGGFSDSISVTATRSRNPPPQPPSPPARRAQLHDESPTYLDDEDAAGPSWGRGHSSATSGRTGQHNSPLFPDNALGTFASPFDSELSLGVPFSSRRGERGGGRDRGEGVVSAMQVQAMLQDDEAVLFDRSRQRSPRYREGDDDAWHRAGARELPLPTGSPSRPWEDLDHDVNLWGDYPTSGSPVRPSEGLFGRRHYDDNDDEEPMLSPSNCSFAPSIRSVQSHSPSYSPAPQCQPSFKWRPSLSAGRGGEDVEYEYEAVDRDDDPYAYVPESSRAVVDVDSFGSPPRFSSPSAGPRQVVPPTPATSGRLVLSLSPPPPRRQPAPAYSKWTSYLD